MKFERGRYVSERAEELKGSLDDVYIIPAHREWGHLLYTLYKTTTLKDDTFPERKHGVVVVINHAPGDTEAARAAQKENAKLFTLVAALNSGYGVRTHDQKDMHATEGSGNRFDAMVESIQKSGIPIIPVYLVEEDMSVAIARHEGGVVARPLLKTDAGLLYTLDAETIPDTKSLERVRKAFHNFPIDVAAMQVLYDMRSMRSHEYAPYMNSVHIGYLHGITRMVDDWIVKLQEGLLESGELDDADDEEGGRPSLYPIIQTAGAGTVLTGRAYDILHGWMRVAGKQLGEDVDIGHRAVRAGLRVVDFHDAYLEEASGEKIIIPAIHWTTPRAGGRADGQGRVLEQHRAESFADMKIVSSEGIRLKRALHTSLALYNDGWGTVTERVPDDVQKELQKYALPPEQLEALWKKFFAWDGVRHTQEHHDVVVAIREIAEGYKLTTVRDYVIAADEQCEKLSAALNTSTLFGERFDFAQICPGWEYQRFMRAALHIISRLSADLPPSHVSEDFALTHRVICMHEYANVVRNVYAVTLETFAHVMNRQIGMETGHIPHDDASRAKEFKDAEELIRIMKIRQSMYYNDALNTISKRAFNAHFYSDKGPVPQQVWATWRGTHIQVEHKIADDEIETKDEA
jgi:hypothetical protein